MIRNLGDLDGDGLDDFVIADSYRSGDGTTNNYFGRIEIYYSKGDASFVVSGSENMEVLGAGISSKTDFNKDGHLDFAYTNAFGEIFIHYGTTEGLTSIPSYTFVSKDESNQTARTMATGDYNGDGCDDIAVSAPTFNGAGSARGQVYIYFGRGTECSSNDPMDGEAPDVVFEGSANNDRLGRGEIYSVGDINGDGKTDFAFSTDNKIFIAYGGDSGGVVSNYDLTGFQALVGRRIGYGNFNGDVYSDLVVADNNKVLVYYGGSSGISASASITINDISPINYTYPPTITNFARAVSPEMTDINGDGLSDLIIASDRGLIAYHTNNGAIQDMPSYFDSYINTTSISLKILMFGNNIIYCDNTANKGNCNLLKMGE